MKHHGFRLPAESFNFAPPPYYCVHQCFLDYSHERLLMKGKECMRAWIGFNNLYFIVPPEQDVTKITTGQIEDYIDWRMQHTGSLLTPRRELSFVKTAIAYAHRRNRIQVHPYFELPYEDPKRRRALTEDEFKLVMRQKMSGRLRRFYRIAYYTGHRAQAIEQLTWDRVRFDPCTLDFNVPGMPKPRNKRRNDAFPIADEFVETLRGWKAMAKDHFVIGEGGTTYPEADYVVRELAGIKDPTLVPRHCMRKMYVTDLFAHEADPELVADLVKDNPDILRKHYVTHSPARLRGAANLRVKH